MTGYWETGNIIQCDDRVLADCQDTLFNVMTKYWETGNILFRPSAEPVDI